MKFKAFLFCILALIILAASAFLIIPEIKKHFYPQAYSEYVQEYSATYSVPEALIYSVIYCESDFQPDVTSHAGAVGLMQLTPETFDWLAQWHVDAGEGADIFDPKTNIMFGTYYLSYLHDRFGNWKSAIAAYNAGPANVDEWLADSRFSDDGTNLKNIPYEETMNYVNRVFSIYKEYSKLYYNGENLR